MRTRHLAAATLLAVALPLAGCGSAPDSVAAAPRSPTVESGTATPATLTIRSTYTVRDVTFFEGAVMEILLQDGTGRTIATRRADPGTTVRFPDLPAATYIVRAALHPCDANCGTLDPRVDECTALVDLPRRRAAVVDFLVGERCSIRR